MNILVMPRVNFLYEMILVFDSSDRMGDQVVMFEKSDEFSHSSASGASPARPHVCTSRGVWNVNRQTIHSE